MYDDVDGNRALAQELVDKGTRRSLDAQIIRKRFLLGKNAPPGTQLQACNDIAQQMGLRRSSISEIVHRALRHVRIYAKRNQIQWPENSPRK